MFQRLSKGITYQFMKRGIIDKDEREVYTYGIEVILLNGVLLIAVLLISMVFNEMVHCILFLVSFVPLRMFLGGSHLKKSGHCMALSILLFLMTVILVKCTPNLCQERAVKMWLILNSLLVCIAKPIVSDIHPLERYQYVRNKRIAQMLVLANLAVYFLLIQCQKKAASSDAVFVLLSTLLFILEKVRSCFHNKKRLQCSNSIK